MQVPGYHLSLSLSLSLSQVFSNKRAAFRESARPLSTYSLHTLALAPSARLRRPMKIPRGATRSSERHLHTTQLSLRHRRLHGDARDSSGEAFVSRSLAVLLQKAESDAGADQMFPTTVAQGQADIGQQQAASQQKITNGILSAIIVIRQRIIMPHS